MYGGDVWGGDYANTHDINAIIFTPSRHDAKYNLSCKIQWFVYTVSI